MGGASVTDGGGKFCKDGNTPYGSSWLMLKKTRAAQQILKSGFKKTHALYVHGVLSVGRPRVEIKRWLLIGPPRAARVNYAVRFASSFYIQDGGLMASMHSGYVQYITSHSLYYTNASPDNELIGQKASTEEWRTNLDITKGYIQTL